MLAAYGVAMWLTIVLSFEVGFASNSVVAIWPAAGIAVWVAVRYGWQSVPVVFIAQFAYSLAFQREAWLVYGVTSFGNALACYAAAIVYRRLGGDLYPLTNIRGVVLLIFVLGGIMSVIAAVVGAFTVVMAFDLPGIQLLTIGWRWFFSDLTGVLLIAPACFALHGHVPAPRLVSLARLAAGTQTQALYCLTGLLLLYLCIDLLPDALGQYPIVLLSLPLCIWLAFNDDSPSAVPLLSATVVSALSLTLAAIGDVTESGFLAVQLYGVVVMFTSLMLHATSIEKGQALQTLADERLLLEEKVAQRTAELRELAETDTLTGLANRRAFEMHLKHAFAELDNHDNPSFLLFMDLDQFKIVNDTSGHAAGDALLRAVTSLLKETVRADDPIARLGGDEFALILMDCRADKARAIAENVRAEVEALRFRWENEVHQVGVSIGVVTLGRYSRTLEDVKQLADAACYAAKNGGRNRVQFADDPDSNLEAHRGEIRWARRLSDAMEHNRFALYGQLAKKPIQSDDQADPEPEHMEVLLRLRDPATRKLIPPGAFLPAAERYDLTTRLDRWVLDSLLRMLMLHEGFGASTRQYWVNLSGSSIGDEHFASYVTEAIRRSRLEPGLINFEITESALVRNTQDATRLINELHALGCKFALDDFGTGVSSFSQLKRLPVDYVKIDGLFVRDLINDPTDKIFVQAIIDIAHTMNIKAIAEFVENDDIRTTLHDMGIDLVQGMGVHRPVLLTPEFA
ncbi:MAG: EAL domain-containing protein, partial [Pseudomonadota bacterium]